MQWGGDGEEGQCAVDRRVDHFLWHVHVAQKKRGPENFCAQQNHANTKKKAKDAV